MTKHYIELGFIVEIIIHSGFVSTSDPFNIKYSPLLIKKNDNCSFK